jgi:hypothetical protein
LRKAKTIDMILDKEATSRDDVLDAMSLACRRITINIASSSWIEK